MNNLRMRVLFGSKRIGMSLEYIGGELVENSRIMFTDGPDLLEDTFDYFTDWMEGLGIEIEKFESDHMGLFAYSSCSDEDVLSSLGIERILGIERS
jgi:hypothetical protein